MNLSTKLSDIRGVGPKTALQLSEADINTVGDIIDFLPRAHEDFSKVIKVSDLKPGKVTVKVRCEKCSTRFVRRSMRVTSAVLYDDSGKVEAVWFNQPYREKQLLNGGEFYLSGEFGLNRDKYLISSPSVESVKDLPIQTGRVLPVYPKKKGVKPSLIRKIIGEIRPLIAILPETLPDEIIKKEKLLSRSDAMLGMHFPEMSGQVASARERLEFEELFSLIFAARLNKNENTKLEGFKIAFNQPKIKKFIDSLPFLMTPAQKRALWDILQDFENLRPMNRLLQGDVGSGKTVVAGAAAYQASLAGYQTAFMAPTEILATQHADTLERTLSGYGLTIGLLTGSVKGKSRIELLSKISDGSVDVIVGTHALFQKSIKFHKLGFAIIDEQHRFGVGQRQDLLAKGTIDSNRGMPHLLSMTATPIPRSLQLTLFGDLDISIINQLPKGRKPIKTEIISPNSCDQMNKRILEELRNGRQAYFVASLIEDSSLSDQESVASLAKKIALTFKDFKIDIMHGKMDGESKDKIMHDFMEHRIDILVSTTVIEVGVDVPNATIIVIENADHFGLSQLHQLRGRVGRSSLESYCFLVQSDSSAPTRRLREIERSNDGFYLSEVDLRLRGAGEIYGKAQHGQINLKIANLADTKMIARVSRAVDQFLPNIINNPTYLIKYKWLTKEIKEYQRLTTLN